MHIFYLLDSHIYSITSALEMTEIIEYSFKFYKIKRLKS